MKSPQFIDAVSTVKKTQQEKSKSSENAFKNKIDILLVVLCGTNFSNLYPR